MGIATSPGICHIDLSAIVHNFRALGAPQALMPVIKADAYGHGLIETAQALSRSGAERFAVGLAEEGATLRQLGHSQQILLLMGCIGASDWELALRYGLVPAIGSFDELKDAQALLGRYPGQTLACAIKVDTGMSRLGFSLADAGLVAEFLAATPGLRPELLVSHLACADMPEQEEFTRSQQSIFDQFYSALAPRFPGMLRSMGNSASLLAGSSYEIARPGIVLYGYNPLPGATRTDLKWAMSVSTPILSVREIPAGASVSYGRTFVAKKPMRIAVAACGYASGFSRLLSGNADMLVNGRRCPQIGRICMSMACIDITSAPDVKRGDHAWIMGGGENQVTALELAERLGTIPYEILCLMGELNQRVFTR